MILWGSLSQRGATISSTMNPGIGIETSVMANFMNLFFVALFMVNDGLLVLCQAIKESYRLFPLYEMYALDKTLTLRLISLINQMLVKALILVGPVVVALFLMEAAVGILSRFAPQLNAFSVALSIKSVVAILVLLIYMGPILAPQLMVKNVLDVLQSH